MSKPFFISIAFHRHLRAAFSFRSTYLQFRRLHKMENLAKPLNVLVFTGDDTERFHSIATTLKFCLNPECYLIYQLKPAQVFKDPWQENLKLLLVSSDAVNSEIAAAFGNYVLLGGNIFVSCSFLDVPSIGLSSKKHSSSEVVNVCFKELGGSVFRDAVCYETSDKNSVILRDNQNRDVVAKLQSSSGNVVVSEICLERDPSALKCSQPDFDTLSQSNSYRLGVLKDILSEEFLLKCANVTIPELTPCFLFVSGDLVAQDLINTINMKLNASSGLELVSVDYSSSGSLPTITENRLPVVFNYQEATFDIPFNFEVFSSFLKTSTLGRSLFFVSVVGSTMDVIAKLSHIEGSCVVARQQTQAKGRGPNLWISPVGSASFSVHFSLSLASELGQRLSLIQHLMAVSIVLAVRKTPGYENIDLRLKWPNDIYYRRRVKMGGILVTSSLVGNIAHIFSGCGVNVSNSCPTLCINDVIKHHNSEFGCNLAPYTPEQLIASSLSHLEKLIIEFQGCGPEPFFQAYYAYWAHDKQRVTLEATGEEVTIVGLNEYGYLLVEDQTGKKITLLPGANSFDMMKNLIIAK